MSLDKNTSKKGFSAARSYFSRGYNPIDVSRAVSEDKEVRYEINVTEGGSKELISLEAGSNSATVNYLKQ